STARDKLLGESTVTAADVDPAKIRRSVEPVEKNLAGQPTPPAHQPFVGFAIGEQVARLTHVKFSPLFRGRPAVRTSSCASGARPQQTPSTTTTCASVANGAPENCTQDSTTNGAGSTKVRALSSRRYLIWIACEQHVNLRPRRATDLRIHPRYRQMIDHARHAPLSSDPWRASDVCAAVDDIVADELDHVDGERLG